MGKDMRQVYAETLVELAEKNNNIVLLEADLMAAHGTKIFKEKFPERFFNVGVSEADMVGTAAGLSAAGKIPFAATFAPFASRRAYDQFFISCNYAKQNVKLVGSDPGITAQLNGGTHMPFEDVALMRVIPDLVIVEPCDTVSLKKLIEQIAEYKGCCYLRLHRKGSITIYDENTEIKIGKANIVKDGKDVTIIASGLLMVEAAIKASAELQKNGIDAAVIDMHTIKPLDKETIIAFARKTGAVVTCENHQITGGLGSAVAEVLAENYPVKMKRVGVMDRFGQVGETDFLAKEYGLTAEEIVSQVRKLLSK